MDSLALILVIIGALNWGLISIFQFDLVASIFGGQDALLSRIVYGLVALAGVYSIKFLADRNNTRVKE
ncbi:DUF378 domain-containing protein [Alkaliphilus oremlandii]|uniref:DUF378 domain-containing protein n=1 Tax=Alkaliphilus oremlandii (strain OhILAs) TaxID=350688 RepID=A8MEJ8_ALKOO|nr:DUF378 domain-containing protein [Alkaliphilus oremlandii]ABW18327.1 protein of unknown function DUF378 [Alkaliphilus oremlandii OhILAs]